MSPWRSANRGVSPAGFRLGFEPEETNAVEICEALSPLRYFRLDHARIYGRSGSVVQTNAWLILLACGATLERASGRAAPILARLR